MHIFCLTFFLRHDFLPIFFFLFSCFYFLFFSLICFIVLFYFFTFSDIDKDGSGTIDFSDFLEMMTSKMSERDSREEILKAFRLFDDDETGKNKNNNKNEK